MTLAVRGVIVRAANEAPRVEEFDLGEPGEGEVRVRILASGVCHSDLHAQQGKFGTEFPYLLGHEATAVIDALGPGTRRAQLGQRVVLSWRSPCGRCRQCATGRPTECPSPSIARPPARTRDGKTLGRVLGLGTFCTHTVVAEDQAIPIDADLRPEPVSLIGCAVATGVGAALYASPVAPGSRVAVFGCGAVGTSVIQGARLARASQIIAVDIHASKLDHARRFGATDVVNARESDPAKAIRKLTGGDGVDTAFEAIGLPDTLAQAMASCGFAGTCVLIGVPAPGATFTYPMTKLFYLRQALRATFCGDVIPARDFPLLASWYRRGDLKLDELVSRTITLDDVPEAFAALERGDVLRSVISLARE